METKLQIVQWPTGYMTQNARDIYTKISANVSLPVWGLYDCNDNYIELDEFFDEAIRDIANYLDCIIPSYG